MQTKFHYSISLEHVLLQGLSFKPHGKIMEFPNQKELSQQGHSLSLCILLLYGCLLLQKAKKLLPPIQILLKKCVLHYKIQEELLKILKKELKGLLVEVKEAEKTEIIGENVAYGEKQKEIDNE